MRFQQYFIENIYNLFNSCFLWFLFLLVYSGNLLFLCFCSQFFFFMLPPFNLHFAAPGIFYTNSMKTCIKWSGELLIILHYFDVNEFFWCNYYKYVQIQGDDKMFWEFFDRCTHCRLNIFKFVDLVWIWFYNFILFIFHDLE